MTVTYTTDGGLVGVSFLSAAEGGSGGLDGGFGGGGGLPSFGRTLLAKLTSSLILDEGTGGPTWSRATKAWGFNELGYLEELASGCAFFGGARLVRNTVRTASEDFSNAAWTRTGSVTTTSANTIVCVNATSVQGVQQPTSPPTITAGQTYSYNIRARYVPGGAEFIQILTGSVSFGNDFINVSLVDGSYAATGGVSSSVSEVVPGTYDIRLNALADATGAGDYFAVIFANSLTHTRYQAFVGDGIKSFELLRAWSVDVTNYDASYVPEYVSVGVEASPYFGAGIDGAKYFETDWQGAPIAAANLLGFRREAAATNNLLHSRDLGNAAWSTKTNITAAKTATGLDGIANTATTLTATAADAIILQPISLASAARCASAYVKRKTGTGTISFTQDGTNWTDITAQINSSTWSRVQITSTLANPSVGFKISASGDAIDVDVVQNEAGAVATSPIVTTTATVTRNADSLTYQTASNWSDTEGTAYIEAQPWQWSSGGLLGSATNGLLESASNSGATAYDGTNAANGPTGTPSGRKKLALRWTGATMDVSVGGVIGTAGTYDGAMGLASLGIAVNSSGYFGPVAVWNYAMTDDEFKALTT